MGRAKNHNIQLSRAKNQEFQNQFQFNRYQKQVEIF